MGARVARRGTQEQTMSAKHHRHGHQPSREDLQRENERLRREVEDLQREVTEGEQQVMSLRACLKSPKQRTGQMFREVV